MVHRARTYPCAPQSVHACDQDARFTTSASNVSTCYLSQLVCVRAGEGWGVLGEREKRERIDRRLTIYRKEGEGMLLTEDRHKSIAGPTQAGYL